MRCRSIKEAIYSIVYTDRNDKNKYEIRGIDPATARVNGDTYEYCYRGSDVLHTLDLRDLIGMPLVHRACL